MIYPITHALLLIPLLLVGWLGGHVIGGPLGAAAGYVYWRQMDFNHKFAAKKDKTQNENLDVPKNPPLPVPVVTPPVVDPHTGADSLRRL